MTLAERLKAAMDLAKVNQAQLARACQVKPPSVHGWLSGKAKFLRGENLLSAAAFLGVNQQWLATGKGPMQHEVAVEQQTQEKNSVTELPPPPYRSQLNITELIQQLGRLLEPVEEQDREAIAALIKRVVLHPETAAIQGEKIAALLNAPGNNEPRKSSNSRF